MQASIQVHRAPALSLTIMLAFLLRPLLEGATASEVLVRRVEWPCTDRSAIQWVRHPRDCAKYYICHYGQPLSMPSCPLGQVWGTNARNCVPEDSRWNDCSGSAEPVTVPLHQGTEFAKVETEQDIAMGLDSSRHPTSREYDATPTSPQEHEGISTSIKDKTVMRLVTAPSSSASIIVTATTETTAASTARSQSKELEKETNFKLMKEPNLSKDHNTPSSRSTETKKSKAKTIIITSSTTLIATDKTTKTSSVPGKSPTTLHSIRPTAATRRPQIEHGKGTTQETTIVRVKQIKDKQTSPPLKDQETTGLNRANKVQDKHAGEDNAPKKATAKSPFLSHPKSLYHTYLLGSKDKHDLQDHYKLFGSSSILPLSSPKYDDFRPTKSTGKAPLTTPRSSRTTPRSEFTLLVSRMSPALPRKTSMTKEARQPEYKIVTDPTTVPPKTDQPKNAVTKSPQTQIFPKANFTQMRKSKPPRIGTEVPQWRPKPTKPRTSWTQTTEVPTRWVPIKPQEPELLTLPPFSWSLWLPPLWSEHREPTYRTKAPSVENMTASPAWPSLPLWGSRPTVRPSLIQSFPLWTTSPWAGPTWYPASTAPLATPSPSPDASQPSKLHTAVTAHPKTRPSTLPAITHTTSTTASSAISKSRTTIEDARTPDAKDVLKETVAILTSTAIVPVTTTTSTVTMTATTAARPTSPRAVSEDRWYGLSTPAAWDWVIRPLQLRLPKDHPCRLHAGRLVGHPKQCHWYYNCTLPALENLAAHLSSMEEECRYPQLFDLETGRCREFINVRCMGRFEPVDPCEYQALQCRGSNCMPCHNRYGSCRGRENGIYSFHTQRWTPTFITCYQQRNIAQDDCQPPTPIFSPDARDCVALFDVPKDKGGLRPDCAWREDGFYPDEQGRCGIFFECRDSQFAGYDECPSGTVFDPLTLRCQLLERSSPPCGEGQNPSCAERQDGFHADPFGRCPYYFECRQHQFVRHLTCDYGSFDPLSRECVIAAELVPQPCGLLPNPCQGRPSGFYPDESSGCRSFMECSRGVLVSTGDCPAGSVYSSISGKCDRPENAPEPCGSSEGLSCEGRGDGHFSALSRGCSFYFQCRQGQFAGLRQCSALDGGFFFNDRTGQCDFPQDICPPCGHKRWGCPLTLN